MIKRIYDLDGSQFSTLEEFAAHFSAVVLDGYKLGGPNGLSLDAFNDVLRGGFGTPIGGFILCWHNSELSRERLGYNQTVARLEGLLKNCHPKNVPLIEQRLAEAKSLGGPTVFDELVEIIRVHGIGGEEAEDGVELQLL